MRTARLCLLALLPLAAWARAGEAPPKQERPLSLDEVVFLTLKHNLRLAAEKLNPKRADTVVIEQMAIFDPTAYGDLSYGRSKAQQVSSILGTRQDTRSATVGLSKLFPLGTVLDLNAGASRSWTNTTSLFTTINPAYSDAATLTLTQPLLRGFGVRVNTAGIATARNELRIAQAHLRDVALATVADAKKLYWELVFAIGNRELLKRSIERALNLQRDVEARVEAKVLGARDPSVAQAKAEVATRQEDIIVADQAVHDTEDAIKVATDLAAAPGIWKVVLVPTTEPPRDAPALDPELAVRAALDRRPDYKAAQILLDNQDIALYVRRNELLPSLALSLIGGYTGLGDTWSDANHSLGTLDWHNWTVGLSLEFPLGNRAARARYDRAHLERRQGGYSLQALERQINLEVRIAVRQVASNAGRHRAAEASVRAEEERLRAEEIRFKEARVGTSQDVLDAQDALARAESRSLRALIDLNRARVDAERRTGTLLDSAKVVFEEDNEPPKAPGKADLPAPPPKK